MRLTRFGAHAGTNGEPRAGTSYAMALSAERAGACVDAT